LLVDRGGPAQAAKHCHNWSAQSEQCPVRLVRAAASGLFRPRGLFACDLRL